MELDFYKGKKVLITGHTGFKGSWMCKLLLEVGADVIGYALKPPENENLYSLAKLNNDIKSYFGDIRNLEYLKEAFRAESPEVVIHMAAQPIVRESYLNPVYTYEVNVMGTVNILECTRETQSVKSFVNVTTDKVYENKEWEWGYREYENLNGYDPYSNSKSCSEIVTSGYIKSFFQDVPTVLSTARAGNVIGGGDFAKDRIIPDSVRAAINKQPIKVRNPHSIRPYQHVLEPIVAYLIIAKKQMENKAYAGSYNVGPNETDCWNTGLLVQSFCDAWERHCGEKVSWHAEQENGPHEAAFLKLDCAHIKKVLNWEPKWDVSKAIDAVAEWYVAWNQKDDIAACMIKQISEYCSKGIK